MYDNVKVENAFSKHALRFYLMSTVNEIIEAVRELSPEQKRQLVLQLEAVLFESGTHVDTASPHDYFSPEFTARLIEHFHRAKRAAISRS